MWNTKLIRCFGTVAFGLVLLAATASSRAVPRPDNDHAKSAIFPAGRYILAGGPEAALGQDVLELKEDFRLKPGQYILSGGMKPTDLITVDEDLLVRSGDKVLFVDDDQRPSTERRGKQPATYQGYPIILVIDAKSDLKITATDHVPSDAILGELWIHRPDGALRRLTKGIQTVSANQLPNIFFDEEYDLSKGFD